MSGVRDRTAIARCISASPACACTWEKVKNSVAMMVASIAPMRALEDMTAMIGENVES